MKRLLLILVCISLFISAFGQSFVLKGIVSSADGELLPGVNVKIQGTTVGTITDIDGNFQLNVNKGAVLEFSVRRSPAGFSDAFQSGRAMRH